MEVNNECANIHFYFPSDENNRKFRIHCDQVIIKAAKLIDGFMDLEKDLEVVQGIIYKSEVFTDVCAQGFTI